MNSKKLLGKGIIRNRMDRLLEQKKNIFRKKNRWLEDWRRFQLLGKDSDEVTYDPKSNEEFKDSLLETTQNSSKSEIGEQHAVNSEYDQAQKKLQRVKVLRTNSGDFRNEDIGIGKDPPAILQGIWDQATW